MVRRGIGTWSVVALVRGSDLERLADVVAVVNGGPATLPFAGSDAPGPRRGRKRASPDREPDAPELGVTPVSLLLACARVKSPAGQDHPMLRLPRSVERPERRVTPRHGSIILTDAERTKLREMTARALGCRGTYVSMTRAKPSRHGVTQERLVMAVPCGTRMCEACDQDRRKREAGRVEGNWRLFWTLGVPAGAVHAAAAWRSISRWVGKLFQELRRELARGPGANVVVDQDERDRIAKVNESRRSGARKHATLQYAWCLEPHQSGWPHLHFVTNASFVSFTWIKALWSRIVGFTVRWANYRRVTDGDGVCRYLSKYISKTTFSPDITAIMYRRRQWASTVPKAEVEKAGWELEEADESRWLFLETSEPQAVAALGSWTPKMNRPGEYALFSRELTRAEYDQIRASRYVDEDRRDLRVWIEDPVLAAHEASVSAQVRSRLEHRAAVSKGELGDHILIVESRDEKMERQGKRIETGISI